MNNFQCLKHLLQATVQLQLTELKLNYMLQRIFLIRRNTRQTNWVSKDRLQGRIQKRNGGKEHL